MRSRRPTDNPLTLLEISRWTLAPQHGLDELLGAGRIDTDAVRQLNSLALLVEVLTSGQPPSALDPATVRLLTGKIATGEAVDEDDVIGAQQWLEHCVALLRRTKRGDYQAALNRLIGIAEAEQ